jgi:hypothetical protein
MQKLTTSATQYTPKTNPFPVALLEIGLNRYLSQCKDAADAINQASLEIAKRIIKGEIDAPTQALLSVHVDGFQVFAVDLARA